MPFGFVYEITPRCNLDCGFCYNVWKQPGQAIGELDSDVACEMLQRVLGNSDAQWLTFTGGEPLLYPDLDGVVAFVRERFPHIRLGLATNATLLTAERLTRLVEAGVEYVEISLFVSDNAGYRRITGRDVFDSVRQAIALVKSFNLSLTVATLLSRETGHDLETIIDIAFALGADILALNRFVPTGEGKKNQQTFLPSTGELDSLLRRADAKSVELGFEIAVTLPVEDCVLPHSRYRHLHFGRCVCGELKWVIGPLGRLRTCEQNTDILGSLLEEDFSTLANLPAVHEFRQKHAKPNCPDCTKFQNCGGGCRFAKTVLDG
ncbi:MAG: radical SAM protein [Phycisphaerae bacterium]|nr:radical SAM protein [Phycisphaerae bacterium]